MEPFLNFIQEKLPFLVNHLYLFLFLGGALEGLNTLILGGFLASFGKVNTIIIFPLLIIAHMINGFLWYTVGYFGGAKSLDKWGHRNKISHNVINKINSYFQRYSGAAIMIARFTFSLDVATMIMSGSLKYDLKKFARYVFFGSTGWVAMTFFVGYFFGQSFRAFFTILKNFTLAVVFLGGAIALIYVIAILLKRYYIGYLTWSEKMREWRDKVVDGFDKFLNGDK